MGAIQTGRPAAGLPAAPGECAVHRRPSTPDRPGARAACGEPEGGGLDIAAIGEALPIWTKRRKFLRQNRRSGEVGWVPARMPVRAWGGPVRGFAMASVDYAMCGGVRARPPAYSGPVNCYCPHDLWGALIIPKRAAPCAADLYMYTAPVARCRAIAATPATAARGRIFRGAGPGQASCSGHSGGFSDSTRSHLLAVALGCCTRIYARQMPYCSTYLYRGA